LAFTTAKFVRHSHRNRSGRAAALRASPKPTNLISGFTTKKFRTARQREIYTALTALLDDLKQKQAAAGTPTPLKNQDIFYSPLSLPHGSLARQRSSTFRRFIEFLRANFSQAKN